MHERGGQPDQAALTVDGGGLYGGDLVLAEALADQIEPRRQRRIAKAPHRLAREGGDDGCGCGFFRVLDLGLSLGQRCRERSDVFTRALHGWPPPPKPQNLWRRILIAWPSA